MRPSATRPPKPPWIRARIPSGENYEKIRSLVREKRLHTVCAEALCPNLGECWGRGTATFLILGGVCTRDCRFCGVRTGTADPPRPEEAEEIADAVSIMNLKHAVITSVTRDDLPDGGAALFAQTIRAIHKKSPGCRVETLVPDFRGNRDCIAAVLDAGPDIFGHNMETVRRLYPLVRPLADYSRSLYVLRSAKELLPEVTVKSGIMAGLGESKEELPGVMSDLLESGCRVLTIGQYLSPSRSHLPVSRYYNPDEFDELKRIGVELGFKWVEAGPLVRSSYHADEQARQAGSSVNRSPT
ncbi:MAG: lipoyl synthase [Syntrophobacteraceae bacterium]